MRSKTPAQALEFGRQITNEIWKQNSSLLEEQPYGTSLVSVLLNAYQEGEARFYAAVPAELGVAWESVWEDLCERWIVAFPDDRNPMVSLLRRVAEANETWFRKESDGAFVVGVPVWRAGEETPAIRSVYLRRPRGLASEFMVSVPRLRVAPSMDLWRIFEVAQNTAPARVFGETDEQTGKRYLHVGGNLSLPCDFVAVTAMVDATARFAECIENI